MYVVSEKMTQTAHFDNPVWFDGKKINEALFCEEFLREYPMVTVNGAFFTVNGRVHDENRLKKVIYDLIKYYVTSGIAKKVTNLLDVMRMKCCTEKLPLYQDRIHVANGTYYLNGTFSPEKDFCRNRLPVSYNPEAPQPVTWLHVLSQLLEPEDILTLRKFMGYCFIPSTKGQKMLLLIGKGGEGKSRIGLFCQPLRRLSEKTSVSKQWRAESRRPVRANDSSDQAEGQAERIAFRRQCVQCQGKSSRNRHFLGQVYSCCGADAHDTEKVQYGVHGYDFRK